MKVIGLLGGMSYYSTAIYYRLINEQIEHRLGPHRSARLILYSVDFGEVIRSEEDKNWRRLERHLIDSALAVEAAGAGCIVICSNTMHKFAEAIASRVSIPLLHIADALLDVLRTGGYRSTALLGTRFTMEQPFYKSRLEANGIDVVIPSLAERQAIQTIIFDELVRGQLQDSSRSVFVEILAGLAGQGAQSAILGCTEIGLLVGQKDTNLPLLDSTEVHALAAVDWALSQNSAEPSS